MNPSNIFFLFDIPVLTFQLYSFLWQIQEFFDFLPEFSISADLQAANNNLFTDGDGIVKTHQVDAAKGVLFQSVGQHNDGLAADIDQLAYGLAGGKLGNYNIFSLFSISLNLCITRKTCHFPSIIVIS